MLTSGMVLQDRYRLTEQLSANPARQTWLAVDTQADRQVVVKLLALGGAVQWNELKLFEREAEVLAQLDHPRIPKYYEFFAVDERTLWFGLVQQYIAGISLKDKLKVNKSLKVALVKQVAEDVLEILQFLHAQAPPVLHRDIKPSNLIWGEDDRVYLIDFGAVQARSPHPGATFTIVGTYGYTPLEQYGGQAVAASDLYALGATLIHLLTGVTPSELPQQDLKMKFRGYLPHEVEPPLASWLETMTQPAREKRFSSATEALEALKVEPTSPPTIPPKSSTSARLYQSLDRLVIEIPSRFEVEWAQPLSRALSRGIKLIRDRVRIGIQRFQGLETEKKRKVAKSAAFIVVLLLIVNAIEVFPLVEIVFALVLVLLSMPIASVAFLFPFGAIAWLILSQNRSDFFEKTRVFFNRDRFEIERTSTQGCKRDRGETLAITGVEVTTTRDRQGRLCQGIAILTQNEHKILFLSTTSQNRYIFGETLSEAELNWLAGEIQHWLANYANESPSSESGG